MSKGPFYTKDDVGAINRLVDRRNPRTEMDGVVVMVEATGFVWCLLHGSSNAVVVDTVNGVVVKQNDKVSLRRFPNTPRWTIYAVQTLGGVTSSGPGTPSSDNSTTVTAPSNLAVTATIAGIYISWEPPNDTADSLFEVEISTDGIGTGAVIYKVAGSLLFFPCTTIRYARVRSLGKGWSRSGFTGRLSATPIILLETIDDRVAALLVEGDNIDLDYDDTANTLTVSASAPAITVVEDDLSPSIFPINKIIVPAGSLTDDGGGVARLTFPTGPDIATTKKTIQTETIIDIIELVAPAAYINIPIPAGYSHVKIRARLKTDHTSNRYTQVNGYLSGDLTNTHYYYSQLQSQGSSAPGGGIGNFPFVGFAVSSQVQQDAANYGEFVIDIPFSDGTTGHWQDYIAFNLFHAQGENIYQEFMHVQWLDTSAVDAFRFVPTSDGSNFLAGCYIEIVGYKPEQVVTAISGDLTAIVKEYETVFDYSTSSPLALRTVNADEKVISCKIIIDTIFNAAASLHVGEMGGTSRLMADTENDPLRLGLNETNPEFIYSGGEIVNLYITTSATAGAGRVCLVTKG